MCVRARALPAKDDWIDSFIHLLRFEYYFSFEQFIPTYQRYVIAPRDYV